MKRKLTFQLNIHVIPECFLINEAQDGTVRKMSKVNGSEEEIANTEIYDINNKDRKRTHLDQNKFQLIYVKDATSTCSCLQLPKNK